MSIMLALGDYRFSINTSAYQSLSRSKDYRWKSQERIHNDPALQYVGPGEEKIELDGIIYPHYRGGLGQIDAMKESADQGEPLLLVDGRGYVHGYWVIMSAQETQEVFLQNGVPRKIGFGLSLKRYGDSYDEVQNA